MVLSGPISLVFLVGESSIPSHAGAGSFLESDPEAPEIVFGTCVKLSLGNSALRSRDGSSGLAWPLSVEGQFSTGVDVEMGAAMGDEKEKTEGDSEDGVSAPCPDLAGTGVWPELERRAERKRGEAGEEGSLAVG